jgi:hypothetical protein
MVFYCIRELIGIAYEHIYLYLGVHLQALNSLCIPFRSFEEVEKRWISYSSKGSELKLSQV